MRWAVLLVLGTALAGVFLVLASRRGLRQTENPKRRHVVLVGASIGQAWQLAGWPTRTSAPEFTSESIAVWAFDKTAAIEELLMRPHVRFHLGRAYLRSLFDAPRKPDIVILKECSSYFPGSLENYASRVRGWVERLRTGGVQVVLATVVPVTQARAARDPGKQAGILAYNDWVRTYAREQGLSVLDLEAALRTDDGGAWLRDEFAAKDGSHLVPAAYAVLDRGLLTFLRDKTPAGAVVAGQPEDTPPPLMSQIAIEPRRWFHPLRSWLHASGSQEVPTHTPETYPKYLRKRGLQVGRDCRILSLALHVGVEGYLIKIGDRVVIEKDACCMTHDGAAWVFRHLCADLQVYGPIVLEDDCRIGAGALVCPGVRIGRAAVVAAGSVVISNVPPETFVIGVPARPYSAPPASRKHMKGIWVS